MKKTPNKSDIRRQIEQQIDAFLQEGGEVKLIHPGISGRDSLQGPLRPGGEFVAGEKTSHTYIPEVVAAIEARRQRPKQEKPKPRAKKPYKKWIYDDFGEPLRWEWAED